MLTRQTMLGSTTLELSHAHVKFYWGGPLARVTFTVCSPPNWSA
jgi:hypothetical protein